MWRGYERWKCRDKYEDFLDYSAFFAAPVPHFNLKGRNRFGIWLGLVTTAIIAVVAMFYASLARYKTVRLTERRYAVRDFDTKKLYTNSSTWNGGQSLRMTAFLSALLFLKIKYFDNENSKPGVKTLTGPTQMSQSTSKRKWKFMFW